MKKSTQWIALSILAVTLIIVLINILLGRRLRQGCITTIEQEQAAQRLHFRLGTIHYLCLSGTLWVNIIPADSDAIQVPEDQVHETAKIPFVFRLDVTDGRFSSFRQLHDTLYVLGHNGQSLHRPFADWYYRQGVPQINVYVSDLRAVQVISGQIVLKGRSAPVTGSSLRLAAQHSTIWLGEMDNRPGGGVGRPKFPDEFFDTVSLHLTHSILLVNRPAIIADLRAAIDSSSELNDRSATLGRSHISASPDSRVSLTGSNLSKTIITSE